MTSIILPGCEHVVFTTLTAVCKGGFFYASDGFERTLDAMVNEHLHYGLCNSSDPNLTVHLLRLWVFYTQKWDQLVQRSFGE